MRNSVITGASSGIGRALALALLGGGARVIANGRNQSALQRLTEEAGESSNRLRCVAGDICDHLVVDALVDAAYSWWNAAPDLCVVNAGRGLPGTVLNSQEDKWAELIRLNFLAAMVQLRRFAACMLKDANADPQPMRKRDIVVIGSTVGRSVSPANPVYGATKFALHSVAESLRRDLATTGIRVTLIEPGFVRTNFQSTAGYHKASFAQQCKDIGPILEAEDVAEAIVFAISRPHYVHINNIAMRPTRQVP